MNILLTSNIFQSNTLQKHNVKIRELEMCEYGVLEITSDTKVSSHESQTSDFTRLLYHA